MILEEGKREIFINEQKLRNIEKSLRTITTPKTITINIIPVDRCLELEDHEKLQDEVYENGYIGIESDKKSLDEHLKENDFISIRPFKTQKDLEKNIREYVGVDKSIPVRIKKTNNERKANKIIAEEDFEILAEIVSKHQIKEFYETEDAYYSIKCIARGLKEYLDSKGYDFKYEALVDIGFSFNTTYRSLDTIYTKNEYYCESKEEILKRLRRLFNELNNDRIKYRVQTTKQVNLQILEKVEKLNGLIKNNKIYDRRKIINLYKEIEKYFISIKENKNKDLNKNTKKALLELSNYFLDEEDTSKKRRR